MHKIYLDQCVFQDLKKEEHRELLEKVLQAKKFVVFPFSMAHLHDLSRDKSEEKYADMDFMESITDSNFHSFSDRTEFRYQTPKDTYDSFEWPDTSGLELFQSEEGSALMSLMDSLQLPFTYLMQDIVWPANMPTQMKVVLSKSSTMGDFTRSMLEFSNTLSTSQPDFKEHLKYLHQNSMIADIYNSMGIEGYDGKTIIDREKFWSSYAAKFIVEGKEKTRYDLFTDMYHGLEVYGFVKGKPKKQKMMNLLNDGSHAFFGTVCDIVVSKDTDFLEKTRFMYDIEGLKVKVINLTELSSALDELENQSHATITDMLREINAPVIQEQILRTDEPTDKPDDISATFIGLKQTYYAYFNVLQYTTDSHGTYWAFLKEPISHSRGTLLNQIEYIIARVTDDLGPDSQNKGEYSSSEEIKDNMEIRSWRIGDYFFALNLEKKLSLVIYPIDYLEKRFGKDSAISSK